MALHRAEAVALLAAVSRGVAYTPPVTPLMLRLMTAMGADNATAGTEVVNAGGSAYAAQSLAGAWTATTSAAVPNTTSTAAVTFTNMPATTVVGVEVWDSAGSPRRTQFGGLTANKTTALGDSLAFAAGALASTLS